MKNSKIFGPNAILLSNSILTQFIKNKMFNKEQHPVVVSNKSAFIFAQYLGFVFLVHNGQYWNAVTVKEPMIGRKFGEFVFTKKIAKFAKKNERRRA